MVGKTKYYKGAIGNRKR